MQSLYLSFHAVIVARLIAGARGWKPDGEFSLGRWGAPIAAGASIGRGQLR